MCITSKVVAVISSSQASTIDKVKEGQNYNLVVLEAAMVVRSPRMLRYSTKPRENLMVTTTEFHILTQHQFLSEDIITL